MESNSNQESSIEINLNDSTFLENKTNKSKLCNNKKISNKVLIIIILVILVLIIFIVILLFKPKCEPGYFSPYDNLFQCIKCSEENVKNVKE